VGGGGERDGGLNSTFLSRIGRSGDGPGEMRFVTGLDFDVQGRLYVADSNNHRVTVWAEVTVPTRAESFGAWKVRGQGH